jgi:hypothetical protein
VQSPSVKDLADCVDCDGERPIAVVPEDLASSLTTLTAASEGANDVRADEQGEVNHNREQRLIASKIALTRFLNGFAGVVGDDKSCDECRDQAMPQRSQDRDSLSGLVE